MTERVPPVQELPEPGLVKRLIVAGHLDDPGAERLRALLTDAILPGLELTLDVSRVTRLTYPALEALVAAHRRLQEGAGSLVLLAPSAPVVRALRVSGLDRVLVVQTAVPTQRVRSGAPRG